jgi:hypothetical protein
MTARTGCGYCGNKTHPTSHCPKTHGGQANRARLRCSYCGSRNHNRDACTKAWPGANPIRILDR